MLLHLAMIGRRWVVKTTTWLLVTVFAIDQLADTILDHVWRRYWRPITQIRVEKRHGKLIMTYKVGL